MPDISVEILIYDPAIKFKKIPVPNPTVDTWHSYTLITKKFRDKLPKVKEKRKETLRLSGGMSMNVPLIEIGIQIGSIQINNVDVLVVDDGFHDLLLGNNIIESAFKVGKTDESEVAVTSKWKDDPEALSLELYPIKTPVDLRLFENILKSQREIFNIHLIVTKEIELSSEDDLNLVIEKDHNIPENMRLKLTWIDSGSIWLTLKSKSLNGLKYLGSLFETGAAAKFEDEVKDCEDLDDDKRSSQMDEKITQFKRDETAKKIKEEQIKLSQKNREVLYEEWRLKVKRKIKEELDLIDSLIEKVDNKKMARELKKRKDKAIFELVDQKILPIVRNIPHPYEPPSNIRALPPPTME